MAYSDGTADMGAQPVLADDEGHVMADINEDVSVRFYDLLDSARLIKLSNYRLIELHGSHNCMRYNGLIPIYQPLQEVSSDSTRDISDDDKDSVLEDSDEEMPVRQISISLTYFWTGSAV